MEKFKKSVAITILSALVLSGCNANETDNPGISTLNRWFRDPVSRGVTFLQVGLQFERLKQRIDEAKNRDILLSAQRKNLEQSVAFIEKELNLNQYKGREIKEHKMKVSADIARVNARLTRWTSVAYLDVDKRYKSLQQDIEKAIRQNTLTQRDKNSLQNSLNWIQRSRAKAKESGGVSDSERDAILAAISRVKHKLNRSIASNEQRWF